MRIARVKRGALGRGDVMVHIVDASEMPSLLNGGKKCSTWPSRELLGDDWRKHRQVQVE
jgi:hypothetical protein